MTEERWVLVVPLKRLERAKTRLDPDPERRARLALAMAKDTVAAAAAVPSVAAVVVASDDPGVESEFRGLASAVDSGPPGLNAALAHAAAQVAGRWPGLRVAALAADLPAVRGQHLAEALAAAARAGRSCVADSRGVGTTLLAAGEHAALDPAFGGASFARHRASGAAALQGTWPGLRRDVDTEAELAEAVRLGVGPWTAAALGEDGRGADMP